MQKKTHTALALILLLAISGCTTPPKAVENVTGEPTATEARLSTAANQAIAMGKTADALSLYERLYTRRGGDFHLPNDAEHRETALNYAQLLRKTGNPQRALAVLAPYVRPNEPPSLLLNEYAASTIETGHFEKAEEILRRVIDDEKASALHADAHNLLGIALDAQGRHKDAENSFRLSLQSWKGDATSVMNNLAVCLASQGLFDESLMTLRQALVQAPDKQEIARNIEMVSALRQSLIPMPTTLR